MHRTVLFAAATLAFALAAQPSFADSACAPGSYTSWTCKRALSGVSSQSAALGECLARLQAETTGLRNRDTDKGPLFDARKKRCRELARRVLRRSTLASAQGGGTDDSALTAVRSLKNWH
jgi:hypothetical protein